MDELPDIDVMAPMGCIGARMRRTSRAVTAAYNEAFREAGIRSTQWPIFAALRVAGSMSLGDLAEAIGTDPSTISRNIRPLVRDGLVDLTTDDDGRKRHARLTPSGVETYNRAYRLWKRVQDEALRLLGEDWPDIRERLVDLETSLR
jgi:DNA-binding MarR family transcriptional regulator